MKQAIAVIIVALSCAASVLAEPIAHEPSIVRQSDGFELAFGKFTEAGRAGDRDTLAAYASPELKSYLGKDYNEAYPKDWRLGDCTLRAVSRRHLSDEKILVEAILERVRAGVSRFHVMYWMRRNGEWSYLNFPFYDAGVISAFHAFQNDSIASLNHPDMFEARVPERPVVEGPSLPNFGFRTNEGEEDKAQPGATDNPDDAQRLREDH